MRASFILTIFYSALLVSAWPSLYKPVPATVKEGFAFHNPIGPTSGGFGPVKVVTTNEALTEAVIGNKPKIIHLKGDFALTARLKVGSNTSLLGLGKGANIVGKGIDITNSTNIVVRNIAIRLVEGGDGMTVQNSTRVWVDHCEFESKISTELGPDFYVRIVLFHGFVPIFQTF
jgi:pectate lyase